MKQITAVVGAQYGSEGKGAVVRQMANDYNIHVRTGGPNAGHTIFHEGRVWKMQQIPCGWVNPNALLVLGRAAVINPNILCREVDELEKAGYNIRRRLIIDTHALVLDPDRHDEGHTQGELHKQIGSTGEGVGACRGEWLARRGRSWAADHFRMLYLHDTVAVLNQSTQSIMLEGTQGFGLSLVHGTWPYVTSRDTTAGQLAVDCGIAPNALTGVIAVARTYPIRVAGNSGPFHIDPESGTLGELTWNEVSRIAGRHIEPERTTVTKLQRRIGRWSMDMVRRAVTVNGATQLVLTFLDYIDPSSEFATEWKEIGQRARNFVDYVENELPGVDVIRIGTGFSVEHGGWTSVNVG